MSPSLMSRLENFLLLSDENRGRVYVIAAALSAVIAWIDWKVETASLGFLYIVPILLASATLQGWQIVAFAIVCGTLRELFNPLHQTAGAPVRVSIGAAGFTLAGFFVSELYRKRQLLALHLREREEEMRLRQEAQQQLRVLVDTSPLAILTLDSAGKVLLANDSAQQNLQSKLRENAELEAYRPKLAEIERQVASLKQQLEIERRIVPDEKEVDTFMKMLDSEALKAGIEVRRYTAKPVSSKEFYTELPFEMELDGPYYSVLNFFQQCILLP